MWLGRINGIKSQSVRAEQWTTVYLKRTLQRIAQPLWWCIYINQEPQSPAVQSNAPYPRLKGQVDSVPPWSILIPLSRVCREASPWSAAGGLDKQVSGS